MFEPASLPDEPPVVARGGVTSAATAFPATALPAPALRSSADQVSAPVATLLAAVGGLRAAVAVDLPGVVALADAAVLLRLRERLTGLVLERLADLDARDLPGLEGAPSLSAWVERQAIGLDRSLVALARRLRCLPAVSRAVSDGFLPLPSGVKIGQALDRLGPHLDRADGLLDGQPAEAVLTAVLTDGVPMLVAQARGGTDDDDPVMSALRRDLSVVAAAPWPVSRRLEEGFVLLARHVEPGRLGACLEQLTDAVLPEQLADAAERGYRDRALTLRRNDDGSGWTVTRGQLDLECGELLHTVLTAELATDPDNAQDTARWAAIRTADDPTQPWHDPYTGPAPRSRAQRQHDALRLGLRRLLDSGALGLRDKAVPHLNVLVGLDALQGAPGARPARGASGAPLPLRMVQRLVCDSALTRVVLGLGGRVLDVSHSARTLKAHERTALAVQWAGQCASAGCHRGPATGWRLTPHHPELYAESRSTSFRDAVPLCEENHHDIHEGNKTLLLKDGRWLGPTGWTTPPAHPDG